MYEHPRLFLPTVHTNGGASAPFGLSSVAATLRSHRSAFAEQDPPLGGGTPSDIVLNV